MRAAGFESGDDAAGGLVEAGALGGDVDAEEAGATVHLTGIQPHAVLGGEVGGEGLGGGEG